MEWPGYPYLNREALEWHADAVSKAWDKEVKRRWGNANKPPFTAYKPASLTTNLKSFRDARVAGKTHCPSTIDWALFESTTPWEYEPEMPDSPALAWERDRVTALLANRDRLRAEREAKGIPLVLWRGKVTKISAKPELPAEEWAKLATRARIGDTKAYNAILEAAFPLAQQMAKRQLPDRKGVVEGLPRTLVDEMRDDMVHVGLHGAAIGDRNTGIWLAIDQWDRTKKRGFCGFMREAMWQRMVDYRRKCERLRLMFDSIDAPVGGGND